MKRIDGMLWLQIIFNFFNPSIGMTTTFSASLYPRHHQHETLIHISNSNLPVFLVDNTKLAKTDALCIYTIDIDFIFQVHWHDHHSNGSDWCNRTIKEHLRGSMVLFQRYIKLMKLNYFDCELWTSIKGSSNQHKKW